MAIKPKLSLFDISMAVVSLIIGMGIFIAPSSVAREAGSSSIFFLAWISGGVIALIGGLTFAEIGSRKPMAGGYYKIVSDSYHPMLAFMLNWMYILVNSGSVAIVTIIGCKYLLPLLHIPFLTQNEAGLKAFSALVLMLLFLINYLGIRTGARVLNVLTVVKITLILAFSLCAFFAANHFIPQQQIVSVSHSNTAFSSFFLGLVAVFFTYGGYQMTINFGADVINPKKNIPLGLIIGVGIVITLYLLINFGYHRILGLEKIASSQLLARDVATTIFNPMAGNVISIVIFISVLGFLNATLMQVPRLYYAMAEDGLLPASFKKVNEKTQVQETALITVTAFSLLFILIQGTFDQILNYIIFNDTIVIAFTASTIFILRRKVNTQYEGFKMPLYPILPAIYILFLLMVSFFSLMRMEKPSQAILSVALIGVGYPLYLLIKRLKIRKGHSIG